MLWPWLVGRSVPARLDNLIATIPWRSFAHQSLLRGELPLWNPHNFCGHPLLAFPATGLLYPIEWGMLLVGPLLWERVNVVLHHVLACVFMYRFLRGIKLWRPGALLGAISFSVGAHLLFHIPWVRVGIPVVWFPLLLHLVERARRGTRPVLVTGAVGIAVAMTLLGGTPQIAFYTLAGFGLYAITLTWRRPKALATLVAGVLLGLGAYTGQYAASRELWRESDYTRLTYQQATVGSLRPWQLWGAFLGGGESASIIARVNYVGVLMIVMAPFAFAGRRHRTRVIVLAALAVGAVLVSLGPATPFHRLLWAAFPPMRSFRAPSRCMFLAGTALCLLGAIGSERFLRRRGTLGWVVTGLVAGALALGLCGVRPSFPGGGVPLLTLGVWGAVACAVGFFARRRGIRWCIAAWLLLSAELYWYGMVRNRNLERAWVSLSEYGDRTRRRGGEIGRGDAARTVGTSLPDVRRAGVGWEYLGEWLAPNLESFAGVWGVQGYSPLKARRLDEFLRVIHGGSATGAVDRHVDLVQNPYSPCLDLLRVRHMLRPLLDGPVEQGLLTLAEQAPVRPARPLQVSIGPCVADSVSGLRIASEVKADERLSPRQQVARLEVSMRSGETWEIPLRVGDHVAAIGDDARGVADFPFGRWVAVSLIRVVAADDLRGGLLVRQLAARVRPAHWRKREEQGGLLQYERVGELPGALVFPEPCVTRVLTRDGALRRMTSDAFDPLGELVVEGEPPWTATAAGVAFPAEIVLYDPRRIELRTDAPVPGYLFLGDSYYPGWSATVDGRPSGIVAADIAFRAVRVPAGAHTVVMRYEPLSVIGGCAVSAGALLAAAGLCIGGALRWGRRKRQ
jgi:hypothetical protein